MKVCIAEKPAVAREIAFVLGASQKKNGYYEGNGYQVTWTLGHLCQLKEPEDYQAHLKSWKLEDLPILPTEHGIKLIDTPQTKKQFQIVKQLFGSATEIINCGDAGQEGELIQRWVYQLSGCRQPLKRLWISSLTEEAIREGFARLRNSSDFENLYQAGMARSVADWLLGMNATRLFSNRYSEGGVLSVGRVQTPTLALVVERNQAIQNFKPEPYWELKTLYREVTFHYEKGKFEKEEDGKKVLEAVMGQPFTILSVNTKQGKEPPPLLYDLTILQMEGNRKFGLTAQQTLNALQHLYEKKLISYPRVDTRYLSQDLYPKVPKILKGLKSYKAQVDPLLKKKLKKTRRIFNDVKVTDHHAIIPTGKSSSRLSSDEASLYDLITKRFIAAFYPDCTFSLTTVIGESAGNRFKVTGKQILDPGWQAIYGKDLPLEGKKPKEGEHSEVLPAFAPGESGSHQPTLEKKMTRPPRPYTEASLLRAMEAAGRDMEDEELRQLMKENGIGRPSTRAAILETLFKREYIYREKKNIFPTQRGADLINLIQNPVLKSAELTGQWERKLRAIEQGTFSAVAFKAEMDQFVSALIQEVMAVPVTKKIIASTSSGTTYWKKRKGSGARKNQSGKYKNSRSKRAKSKSNTSSTAQHKRVGLCPKCRLGNVVKGTKAYGCDRWKEGCNFTIWFEKSGKQLTEEHVKALLTAGETSTIQGFVSKAGKSFEASLRLTSEKTLEFVFSERPTLIKPQGIPGGICPECGKGTIIKGKRTYGCSRWREGCGYRMEENLISS